MVGPLFEEAPPAADEAAADEAAAVDEAEAGPELALVTNEETTASGEEPENVAVLLLCF